MKTFIFAVLIAIAFAHPPNSEHQDDEKPITEASIEGKTDDKQLPVKIYYEGIYYY